MQGGMVKKPDYPSTNSLHLKEWWGGKGLLWEKPRKKKSGVPQMRKAPCPSSAWAKNKGQGQDCKSWWYQGWDTLQGAISRIVLQHDYRCWQTWKKLQQLREQTGIWTPTWVKDPDPVSVLRSLMKEGEQLWSNEWINFHKPITNHQKAKNWIANTPVIWGLQGTGQTACPTKTNMEETEQWCAGDESRVDRGVKKKKKKKSLT